LKDDRKEFGANIEKLAAGYLESQGFDILERNFRVGHKEIDIIAKDEKTVVFVEVKSARQLSFGHPALRITRKQRMNIIAAARQYVIDNMLEGYDFRFDVISYYPRDGGGYTLEHTPGAFMA
jgi:putative endonuclease